MPEIWFPNLNIEIQHLSRVAFHIGDTKVYWYGIFIASAYLLGLFLTIHLVKELNKVRDTKINPDLYYDVLVYIMIFSIIGARLYYVIFDFQDYKDNLKSIFEIWNGGLAIYGGIIGGTLSVLWFCKRKKLNFFDFGEAMLPGLALGQAIGRWGNFVNREAYGRYTDNLFAMRILKDQAQVVTPELNDKLITINGYEYIQVHPTFLYESFMNLINCLVLIYVLKHRKFRGQVIANYMIIYGITRTITEGLRVDQLQLDGLPISRILSMLLIIVGIGMYIYNYKLLKEVTVTEVKDENN